MDARIGWQLICMYRQMENSSGLVECLRELGGGTLSRRAQQFFLKRVLQENVVTKYPPDHAYTARVLKLVILGAEKDAIRGAKMDSDDEEEPVLEEVYAEHAKCMEAISILEHGDSLESKWCYRTYAYAAPLARAQHPETTAKALAKPPEVEQGANPAESTPCQNESGQAKGQSSRPEAIDSDSSGVGSMKQKGSPAVVTSTGIKNSELTPPGLPSGTNQSIPAAAISNQIAEPASTQLVTVRVSLNFFEGGTGCTTWSAGFYLAEFALTNPETFAGKRCLELGAGAGVLGVVLSRLPGVRELILTDGNEETLDNLRGNLRLNGVEMVAEEGWAGHVRPSGHLDSGTGLDSSRRLASSQRQVSARDADSCSCPNRTGRTNPSECSECGRRSGFGACPGSVERPESKGQANSRGPRPEPCTRPTFGGSPAPGGRPDASEPVPQEYPRVRCEVLDWEDVSEEQLLAYDADVILGADVLYDPGVIPDLIRILRIALGARHDTYKDTVTMHRTQIRGSTAAYDADGCRKVALIATAIRNISTLESFVLAVKEAGLKIGLADPGESEDCFQYCRWIKREHIRLHRITLP